jgi:hypothetical protein
VKPGAPAAAWRSSIVRCIRKLLREPPPAQLLNRDHPPPGSSADHPIAQAGATFGPQFLENSP